MGNLFGTPSTAAPAVVSTAGEPSVTIWRNNATQLVEPTAAEYANPAGGSVGLVVLSDGKQEVWTYSGTWSRQILITPSGSTTTTHREPAVTNGQTAFTLPSTPTDATTLRMIVNGVVHASVESPSVLTIAANVVTWTDNLHPIASTDEVWFSYQ